LDGSGAGTVRHLIVVLAVLAAGSCGDDGPSEPEQPTLAGDWNGEYVEFRSSRLEATYDATLSLVLLAPNHYRGELRTTKPRTGIAVLDLLQNQDAWRVDIGFSDFCRGDARGVVTATRGVLTGQFTTDDCAGLHSDSFELMR
jgi:hypothetical protein